MRLHLGVFRVRLVHRKFFSDTISGLRSIVQSSRNLHTRSASVQSRITNGFDAFAVALILLQGKKC